MRLLIVGTLGGQISAATRIAMNLGAKVQHVDTIEQATAALRAGRGADLLMVDARLDIAALIAANERERIVADLGDKSVMIFRNHGTLALGETIGEAFLKMYFLERACEAQVKALSAGEANVNNPPQGAPEVAAEQGKASLKLGANMLAWPALLRKAYRLDPNFAT